MPPPSQLSQVCRGIGVAVLGRKTPNRSREVVPVGSPRNIHRYISQATHRAIELDDHLLHLRSTFEDSFDSRNDVVDCRHAVDPQGVRDAFLREDPSAASLGAPPIKRREERRVGKSVQDV